MTEQVQNPDSLLELGKLYSEKCEFWKASEYLTLSLEGFRRRGDVSSYLKAQNILLRIYAETEQEDKIQQTKDTLQDLVLREGFELNAKTYYTLAMCSAYRGQHQVALEYVQKSLAIALANDNKEDICYAINGTAIVYFQMGRVQEALKEIYNLQIFFEVLPLPEIQISTYMLNATIMRMSKKFDEALSILWLAYDLLKSQKTVLLQNYLFLNLGKVYFDSGDRTLARLYLGLAEKSCDPKNLVRLSAQIQAALSELGEDPKSTFDLMFDEKNHSVVEKKLGRIEFKNQFILLDLLKLFVSNQGQVFSKEYLVENVWKQVYDPAIHDNKIYVTIKRLRKMIEPDFDKPKYIFRAKNGYFMNKSAKLVVDKSNGESRA